jgi:MOSC domain-containing protein YiiM
MQSRELLDRAADDLGYPFDPGAGAAAALRRRAGSTFRLLTSGTIRVGDSVELLPERAG